MKIGPIQLPPISVSYTLVSLSATANSSVAWDPGGGGIIAPNPPHFNGEIFGYITASNADGSPCTNLSGLDFTAHLLQADAGTYITTTTFTTSPVPSYSPGVYAFQASPNVPDTEVTKWVNGLYIIFVVVRKVLSVGLSRQVFGGLTVASASVSFQF